MKTYNHIGIQSPEILLPSKEIDYSKWAVVACDQYTSQPEYWQQVAEIVNGSPSAYRLILPEAFLGTPQEEAHQKYIDATMREYVERKILHPLNGFVYTERSVENRMRRGLIAALDLEQYSFQKGSKSLIRATEGTIIERLPPRIKIRKSALLEIPHILVLIDDPEMSVIEPLSGRKSEMEPLYDFELMQNGGHLAGYRVKNEEMENKVAEALDRLAKPEALVQRYNLTGGETPFLYAVGDGNHSLATAKSIWEEIKSSAGENHPARFALVELVNIHDAGIIFEPIHRLLKNIHVDMLSGMQDFWQGEIVVEELSDFSRMKTNVISRAGAAQCFGFCNAAGFWSVTLQNPRHSLTVGSVQEFLDQLRLEKGMDEIDYVHGDDVILKLGTEKSHAGIYLPALQKSHLFEAVIKDGELPRKTFSMGEANEKRFYLECRKIQA